jgi:hypothetical protein
MASKTVPSSEPRPTTMETNWRNKDYSEVPLDELLVDMENGGMEMAKRETKFEVSLCKLQDGHSDWAINELDNTKTLLDHTTDL